MVRSNLSEIALGAEVKGLEGGEKGPAAKECGWLLEAGMARKQIRFLKLPERNASVLSLRFIPQPRRSDF